jgi:hypothetical protein
MKILRYSVIIGFVSLLTGCAFGQKISYRLKSDRWWASSSVVLEIPEAPW